MLKFDRHKKNHESTILENRSIPFSLNWGNKLLLFLLFALFSHEILAQGYGIFSKEIVLENPFPKIVTPGEIYYLQGRVENHDRGTLQAICTMPFGKWEYSSMALLKNSKFSIPLYFKFPGFYSVELYLQRKTLISAEVLATERLDLPSLSPFPIRNFNISIKNEKIRLNWDSENELHQLIFSQGTRRLTFLLSNAAKQFILPKNDFKDFNREIIEVKLRGARSAHRSGYYQSSSWSKWYELAFQPEIRYEAERSYRFTFVDKFQPFVEVDGKINFSFEVEAYFQPDAIIKRPDGFVDEVELQAAKKPEQYSKYGMRLELLPPGKATFSYQTKEKGIYFIEIIDDEGSALLIQPVYCGKIFPILPDNKIVADKWKTTKYDTLKKLILSEINKIRQSLGIRRLNVDPELQEMADYYVRKMAKGKFVSHFAPDHETLEKRRRKFNIKTSVAENVAMAASAYGAHVNLLNSPGHYANIIDKNFSRVGIGVAKDDEDYFYVAEHFSRGMYTKSEKEQFLDSLFEKMRELRKQDHAIPEKSRDLKRIYKKKLTETSAKLNIRARSLEQLYKIVVEQLEKNAEAIQPYDSVYFEKLEENEYGLHLIIRFYQ